MWRPALVVAAAIAAASATAPQPAAAAAPCGQRVLAAWSNNRLGPNFPVRCYQSALTHLPTDVEGYSSAPADIRRELLVAIRHRNARTPAGVAGATHTLEKKRRTLPPLLLAVGGAALGALVLTAVLTVRRPRAATRRAASRARTRSPRSH